VVLASAVDPAALQAFFESPKGLGYPPEVAAALARSESSSLTQCGITLEILQALKIAMSSIGMDLSRVRQAILPLSKQHVNPDNLTKLYKALHESYLFSGGLGLPDHYSQDQAIILADAKAEVSELYALYKVMHGFGGLGIDEPTAQQLSIQLTLAGADANSFKDAYTASKSPEDASVSAVNADLKSLIRRYDKDTKARYAPEFQAKYGALWLTEWLAAPVELRISTDKMAHTAGQFKKFYKDDWDIRYNASSVAIQMRLDSTPKTMEQFLQSTNSSAWQARWLMAPELPCQQCVPFAADAMGELVV